MLTEQQWTRLWAGRWRELRELTPKTEEAILLGQLIREMEEKGEKGSEGQN